MMTTTTTPPSSSSSSPASQTTRASTNVEYDTPVEAEAAAAEPPPPPSPPTPSSILDSENECVLCCYPFPLDPTASVYKECCGQMICTSCILAQQRILIIGTNVTYPIAGSDEEEQEFREIGRSEWTSLCPFCNAKEPINDKEDLKRLWERIDEYKDPKAMLVLGCWYKDGSHGLTKNFKKAKELFQTSYDLGDPEAAYRLSWLHSTRLVDAAPFPDEVLMIKYLEEGVRRGDYSCRENLADIAVQSGNQEEAIRQYMMAARAGHDKAMQIVMACYRVKANDRQGFLSKDDLATTLRAHKVATDKGRSEPRDYWKRYDDLMDRLNAQEED